MTASSCLPTDTLYGLGADAFSEEAIEKVYEAKKRDLAKPISIAVSDFEMFSFSLSHRRLHERVY